MKQLIIDGYNVVCETEPYKNKFLQGDYDASCDALIADAASFAAQQNYRVTVVFDGTNNLNSTGEARTVAGISVIYSAYGHTADSVIERLASEASSRGESVEVVSNDAQVQRAVMKCTVARRSVREFVADLHGGHDDFVEINDRPITKMTIDKLISPEAVELLRKIRDGH